MGRERFNITVTQEGAGGTTRRSYRGMTDEDVRLIRNAAKRNATPGDTVTFNVEKR